MYINIHVHIYTYIHTYVYMYILMNKYINIHIHICIHMCIYAHTHTHQNTHICDYLDVEIDDDRRLPFRSQLHGHRIPFGERRVQLDFRERDFNW